MESLSICDPPWARNSVDVQRGKAFWQPNSWCMDSQTVQLIIGLGLEYIRFKSNTGKKWLGSQ